MFKIFHFILIELHNDDNREIENAYNSIDAILLNLINE